MRLLLNVDEKLFFSGNKTAQVCCLCFIVWKSKNL